MHLPFIVHIINSFSGQGYEDLSGTHVIIPVQCFEVKVVL
jgi:hypothetical protein